MAFRFRGKEEIRPSPLLCTVLVSSYKSITISKLNQSKKKARKRTSYTCQKKTNLNLRKTIRLHSACCSETPATRVSQNRSAGNTQAGAAQSASPASSREHVGSPASLPQQHVGSPAFLLGLQGPLSSALGPLCSGAARTVISSAVITASFTFHSTCGFPSQRFPRKRS